MPRGNIDTRVGKNLAAEAAKPLVTPAVVKDCKDRLAKAHASSTILGNFTLSPHLAQLVDQHLRVLPGNDNRIVALVVLSSNEGLFGRQMKTIIGCSYRLEDNRLVFRDVHGPDTFRVSCGNKLVGPPTRGQGAD